MLNHNNGLAEECETCSASLSTLESSPIISRGMLSMPPAMPLLYNQCVSAVGHIKNISRSGPEVTSPSKSPVYNSLPASQIKSQKNYTPPLSSGEHRPPTSPRIKSSVSSIPSPLIQSPQIRTPPKDTNISTKSGSDRALRLAVDPRGAKHPGPPQVVLLGLPHPNPGASQPLSPGSDDGGSALPFLEELAKWSSTGN